MRIVIVTQEEPFYLPVFLRKIVQKRKKDIVAFAILSPATRKSPWISIIKQHFEMYGLFGFLMISFRFVWYKVLDKVRRLLPQDHRFYSTKSLASHYSIPVYHLKNINSKKFLEVLANELKPDLIVSVNSSQVFRNPLLRLPRLGCINVHSALLPK